MILNIENDWIAYCFDSACNLFGVYIENKLSETTKDGKSKYKIENLLAEPGVNNQNAARQFIAWLGGFKGRKKKVKKNGNTVSK